MNDKISPIIVEQNFLAPLSDIWKAITHIEQLKKWYFPSIHSFEAIQGFETKFIVKVGDRIFPHHWKITEIIEMQKLAYEWTFSGYKGKGVSIFELFDNGQQRTLKLTFNTIEKFPDNIPEFERESGVKGWKYFINHQLKNFVDKP